MQKKKLGTLISGSLSEGFLMRLNSDADLEEIKTGKFVTITGKRHNFFSLVSDLTLHVTNPDIYIHPPSQHETLTNDLIVPHHVYATARLKPMLMADWYKSVMPVKTIPPHFAPVHDATAEDVATIFGSEQEKNHFSIGTPPDMDTPVCINLEKLTERSNGIFGKTGTGKTFLTRLVLAGVIKNNTAVNVIFDMHSEYGLQARTEQIGKSFVKGLKTLFESQVSIFSLDPVATKRRGKNPDEIITLSYEDIKIEDLLSLQEELNLHATAYEAAHLIAAKYGKQWLQALLSHGENIQDFASSIGAHPESIAALYRKLKKIERFPFFSAQKKSAQPITQKMLNYIDRNISIIIEFGNYTSTFCYLLIANIITRRIHDFYIHKTEKFLGSQKKEDEPKKLLITIEEAHKFLNPQAARQTIFGTIAREMRKYYVSLLVVDQRPSGIDQEILSQIGTKILAQLTDEKDTSAALTGTPNSQQLRAILASLDTKKQVLLLGHAVAMPVVIETRTYDEKFYEAMQGFSSKNIESIVQELF